MTATVGNPVNAILQDVTSNYWNYYYGLSGGYLAGANQGIWYLYNYVGGQFQQLAGERTGVREQLRHDQLIAFGPAARPGSLPLLS